MLNEAVAEKGIPFALLGGVNTVAAIPHEISEANIPLAMARGLPKLQHLPGWKEMKGDAPIALIGAGPSLRDTYHELKDFPVTICAESVHDWLIDHGHIPTYCTAADPDKLCANYVRTPSDKTTYLIASQCHPALFDALEGRNVYTWHLGYGDAEKCKFLEKYDPLWEAVGGGCTVGLRNISIAVMMGYRNTHFFGYDSCIAEDGRTHAQDFLEPGEEEFVQGPIYRVGVNWGQEGLAADSKIFRCVGYQMAQAQHFKDLFCNYGGVIDPTVHGPGLIAEFVRHYKYGLEQIAKQAEEGKPCPT